MTNIYVSTIADMLENDTCTLKGFLKTYLVGGQMVYIYWSEKLWIFTSMVCTPTALNLPERHCCLSTHPSIQFLSSWGNCWEPSMPGPHSTSQPVLRKACCTVAAFALNLTKACWRMESFTEDQLWLPTVQTVTREEEKWELHSKAIIFEIHKR